jgi:hypothetical protein
VTDVLASFHKPFAWQVAAYRLRLGNLVGTRAWDDLRGAEHDRAFMVAGAMKAELLADLASAVDKAVSQGTSLQEFRRDFRDIVEKRGWHGWTGEGTKKGEAWRTKVIYKTNLATSYAAGRMAQLKASGFAFWVYSHGNSLDPRIEHLGWDGLVLEADHPFWATHAPPNGWGCSCYITGARSREGAARIGGKPDKPLPEGWLARDPRTGAPVGISKGWDHAPGASVTDLVAALAEKPVNWDYSLAVAFMKSLPDQNRDLFSTAFRGLPSLAEKTAKYAGKILDGQTNAPPQQSLGLMTKAQEEQIGAAVGAPLQKDAPRLFEWVLNESAVLHIKKRHTDEKIEVSRGQRAVVPDDFGRLAELINDPDTIKRGEEHGASAPTITLSKDFGAERLVAIFEIRLRRSRLNLLTMWIEKIVDPSPTSTP